MRWTWALFPLLLSGCASRLYTIHEPFDPNSTPAAPDYSRTASWAALPFLRDAADSIPLRSGLKDGQAEAHADVFFIYPTIYTGPPNPRHPWNANLEDSVLNREIQLTTILNQATVFNGSCRVYAPYYRQAHLDAFFSSNTQAAASALELAYTDVRSAFQYYLEHFNNGRPLVIASHSQGSYHAMRLIRDFVDGQALQEQLVMAYLIGRAIPRDVFRSIRPTENESETGVWASWNTFGRGHMPASYDQYYANALSINPLLWTSGETYADRTLNRGGVGRKFTMVPQVADAQNHRNLLWIHRPYVPFRFLLPNKVWHRADINLYYGNLRENVAVRVAAFLAKKGIK